MKYTVTAYLSGQAVNVMEFTKKREAYSREAAWKAQGYAVTVKEVHKNVPIR
jgi:hypothetical protein